MFQKSVLLWKHARRFETIFDNWFILCMVSVSRPNACSIMRTHAPPRNHLRQLPSSLYFHDTRATSNRGLINSRSIYVAFPLRLSTVFFRAATCRFCCKVTRAAPRLHSPTCFLYVAVSSAPPRAGSIVRTRGH